MIVFKIGHKMVDHRVPPPGAWQLVHDAETKVVRRRSLGRTFNQLRKRYPLRFAFVSMTAGIVGPVAMVNAEILQEWARWVAYVITLTGWSVGGSMVSDLVREAEMYKTMYTVETGRDIDADRWW